MTRTSRNERGRDRTTTERNQENNQTKPGSRKNTSARDINTDQKMEREPDRGDRLTTHVPDNYERDSE